MPITVQKRVFINTPSWFLCICFLLNACAYEPTTIKKTPRKINKSQTKLESRHLVPQSVGKSVIKIPQHNQESRGEVQISLSSFNKKLIGLSDYKIRELLGAPSFKRREHPASIWQYQSSICLIDIFFYIEKSGITVDHVETRGKTVQKVNNRACFRSILAGKRLGQNRNKEKTRLGLKQSD